MKRAPGSTWRGLKEDRPWAWSQINGTDDLPAHLSGVCEKDWHDDCPQAPIAEQAGRGQCTCPCHREVVS